MMKRSEIFKKALRIELSDIIGKKFDPKKDDLDILPVKYSQRQVAEKITFSSGFLLCLGINILIVAFIVLRITRSLPIIATAAVLGVVLAFIGGCVIATIYLYGVALSALLEQEKEAAKDAPPTERERSDAAFAERMRKKELETANKKDGQSDSDVSPE